MLCQMKPIRFSKIRIEIIHWLWQPETLNRAVWGHNEDKSKIDAIALKKHSKEHKYIDSR